MGKFTIKDVAKKSQVSTATVSRVLNQSGFVSEEIKGRVLSAVKELNYQPNGVARSLKQDKTNTIGVVIPDISNSYFMQISKGIEDTIHQEGYNLIFCSGDENPEKEAELLQLLFEKRVDAIVLATSGGNEDKVKQIVESGTPFILVDRRLGDSQLNLDYVLEDNADGAYWLTSYLINRGHTRIGVINGSLKVSTGSDRYRGYKKAIKENGIQEDPELIFNGTFLQNDGILAVDYFFNLTERPSSILSFNNTMTFGALLELTRKGYSVPNDIVVASYGQVEAAEILKSLGIIALKHSPQEMGLKVGEFLLERLKKGNKGPLQKIFTSNNEDLELSGF